MSGIRVRVSLFPNVNSSSPDAFLRDKPTVSQDIVNVLNMKCGCGRIARRGTSRETVSETRVV